MIQSPHALILSPSATHPQDYGNRNRVWQVTSFIKELGYDVDFLLYPFEAEWTESIPPEANLMRLAWDSFWVVPPSIPLHAPARGDYHQIDEWWDPAIGTYLEWLFARRSYDLFVVNYTFLSKAFTYAPKTTLRILETHDLFTGRKEMLAALGVGPEFFYTIEDEEKIAFDRADVVIAIKDSEATLIQGMTDREVVSLPFFPSQAKPEAPCDTGFAGLSIGFIGAPNSVNVQNFQSFLRQFDPMVRLYCPPLRLMVAGNVCQRLRTDNPAFELLGRVADLDDFYAKVDVVVVPMMFSTGIKIKVAEALAYGKGVVSTVNGFDGFPAMDPMHNMPGMEEVCRALIKLAFDSNRREQLVNRSRMAARLARQSTALAFEGLSEVLTDRSRRIVFVTDRPYWARSGFLASRLTQWVQLCGFLTRVIVCYLRADDGAGQGPVSGGPPDLLEIDIAWMNKTADAEELAERLDGTLRQFGESEIILSVDSPWAKGLCAALAARGRAAIVDLWCRPLSEAARQAGVHAQADLWSGESGDSGGEPRNRGFETMAVRWAPWELRDWAERPVARRVVMISLSSADEAPWLEAESRRALEGLEVELDLVSVGAAENEVEALFARLQRPERPLLLMSIAGSARLNHAGFALSALGDVPFLAIDRDTFPLALADRLGDVQMFHSCAALIEKIVALCDAGTGPCLSLHALDTGWSQFWKVLESRLHRRRAGSGGAQDGAEPRQTDTPAMPVEVFV